VGEKTSRVGNYAKTLKIIILHPWGKQAILFHSLIHMFVETTDRVVVEGGKRKEEGCLGEEVEKNF